MDTVSYPLDKLVKRYLGFSDLRKAVQAQTQIIINCNPWVCRTSWDRFQREFLADCLDGLYVLSGSRDASNSFRRVQRYTEHLRANNPVLACRIDSRAGGAIERTLRADGEYRETVTSWTVRALAYRRAWLYYANRPTPSAPFAPVPVASPPATVGAYDYPDWTYRPSQSTSMT